MFVTVFLPRSNCLLVWRLRHCSDFGAQENNICHCYHNPPIYLLWSDVTACHDLVFWMLSLKLDFSLSSFTLINRFFTSSSLSAIGVTLSACLRILIFLLEILIPVYDSSSPECHMTYSECRLYKPGDSIQTCRTPFPIWGQSVVPCLVLTVASWSAYRLLSRQVR